MSYTIYYGYSTKDGNLLLTLEKNGNKYVTTLSDRSKWQPIHKSEFLKFDDANAAFDAIAKDYGINLVHETKLDPSDLYANYD